MSAVELPLAIEGVLAGQARDDRVLALARAQAEGMLHVHDRVMRNLEQAGRLDRALEALPDGEAIAATATRPYWLEAPNIVFRIGVTATIGTTAIAATSGASMPSTGRAAAANPARSTPTIVPISRPNRALRPVISRSSPMMSPCAAMSPPRRPMPMRSA